MLKRPPTPERIQQARQLLEDGASQREVQRTTGIARETLRKHFPGKGWTYVDGGEFRALTRGTLWTESDRRVAGLARTHKAKHSKTGMFDPNCFMCEDDRKMA